MSRAPPYDDCRGPTMTSPQAGFAGDMPNQDLSGRSLTRDAAGYEAARRGTMWNANVPARFPDRIVRASSVDDVIAAVRAAKADGKHVGVRSGGPWLVREPHARWRGRYRSVGTHRPDD